MNEGEGSGWGAWRASIAFPGWEVRFWKDFNQLPMYAEHRCVRCWTPRPNTGLSVCCANETCAAIEVLAHG